MGTAHVLIFKSLYKRLLQNPLSKLVSIESSFPFDEEMMQVLVRSGNLPDGYNGQMEIFLVEKEDSIEVQFKPDRDC